MPCKVCAEWKKEMEYWKRESERHKEACRELSLKLEKLREETEG